MKSEFDVEQWNRINEVDRINQEKLLSTGWWHSIDLGGGVVTPGARTLDELQRVYASFRLPEDLSGKRVLDIGCWDGFFSFEAERRGAQVVAADCWPQKGFFEARRMLNSRVEFHELSVYDITRERLGEFDIVLMLGVLYHLQHPLLALQRVCAVTREIAIIESHVIDGVLNVASPVMQFYEMDELGGQHDNWWGPNTDCMKRMCAAAGFVRSEIALRENNRTMIKAHRRFDESQIEYSPSLEIVAAVNSFSFEPRLPRQGRTAFLTILANGLPEGVSRDDAQIVVNGYGALPTYVGPVGNPDEIKCQAQINAPVPPGLSLGRAEVRLLCKGKSSGIAVVEIIEGHEW
jgi:tRNA (mo5U34)-methyltransferase